MKGFQNNNPREDHPDQKHQVSRQRTKQLEYREQGKCIICGADREPDGTKIHCKKHADRAKELAHAYYLARKAQKENPSK